MIEGIEQILDEFDEEEQISEIIILGIKGGVARIPIEDGE